DVACTASQQSAHPRPRNREHFALELLVAALPRRFRTGAAQSLELERLRVRVRPRQLALHLPHTGGADTHGVARLRCPARLPNPSDFNPPVRLRLCDYCERAFRCIEREAIVAPRRRTLPPH